MNQEMMNAKVEDIQILLEENGVTLSDEEIEKMLVLADATSDDELSEELLDTVAGGVIILPWLWLILNRNKGKTSGRRHPILL